MPKTFGNWMLYRHRLNEEARHDAFLARWYRWCRYIVRSISLTQEKLDVLFNNAGILRLARNEDRPLAKKKNGWEHAERQGGILSV
ncbi:hypothetical protein ACFPTO_18320 [Paraburkholderia denitrificans]|uniref:Uncharacterized protein n=1 Tax=Paraburkholderia denitrificans TaxID=694025 RepID=A0ABW0JCJ1_9BURK